ncbi:unnamed protein product [Mytilus coruscus]|uniref:Roc domain-containing protein n=1 Tax=Mytilus coruscus TaxID=42192 RepID=A0A6J8AG49_MYTCO|nr:unnamed protein product [Mytilus coruscus]
MYLYHAYVAVCASESLAFLRSFLDRFECNGYSFFCDLRDMESGSIIVDEIERKMRISGSLIIVYDNSFFKDDMAKFTIEVGKQIQLGNKYFKLIALEVMPIPAEHLSYFKSFSRISVKKHYEERAYQQILKILTDTDLTEDDIEVENRRLKHRNEQIAVSILVNLQPPQKLFSECRKGIDLYKKLVETKSEELYFIRLVVLGQEGVGKTSLVRRLLQESISQVKSTNGIEINVNKYGISLCTGEWKFHKDLFSTNGNAILFRKFTQMEEYEKLRREISKEKMGKDKVLFKLSNVGRSIRSLVESENERAKHEAWKESLQNLPVENSLDSGRTATISVWDFAGQQEYYPTHQLFLSKNCIVLLVSNISKGLDQNELQETVLYERNPNRKQILSEVHDYVQYWTKTVHCYGDISRNEDKFLNPPIIPVATHVDKIQSNVQEHIDDYREA